MASHVTILNLRVSYLIANGAYTYRQGVRWRYICSTDITAALCATASSCGTFLAIFLSNISTRGMRAGGTVALLLAGVGGKRIKILVRWRSDIMMRYLHTSACPILHGFVARMVRHGDYALILGSDDIALSADD